MGVPHMSDPLSYRRGGPSLRRPLPTLTEHWDNGVAMLYEADARAIPLADGSVHCVVTSPPYWGLRDYGLGLWEGGDAECDHEKPTVAVAPHKGDLNGGSYHSALPTHKQEGVAEPHLRALRRTPVQVEAGIGLEATLAEHLDKPPVRVPRASPGAAGRRHGVA